MEKGDKDTFLKILPEFCRAVDPKTLVNDLQCLSESTKEEVVNSQIAPYHGSSSLAAQKLHSALIRRPHGFKEIVLALRKNNNGSLADKLDPLHVYMDVDEATSSKSATSPPAVMPASATGDIGPTPNTRPSITLETLWNQLPVRVTNSLKKMDRNTHTVEDLAEHFDLTNEEYEELKSKADGSSITLDILKLKHSQAPEFKLRTIYQALQAIQRLDIVSEIEQKTGVQSPFHIVEQQAGNDNGQNTAPTGSTVQVTNHSNDGRTIYRREETTRPGHEYARNEVLNRNDVERKMYVGEQKLPSTYEAVPTNDMETAENVNAKSPYSAGRTTEPNIGSPGFDGGPKLSLSEQFQQSNSVSNGQSTNILPKPTWSMSQRPKLTNSDRSETASGRSTTKKTSIHDSNHEAENDLNIDSTICNNIVAEDSDSDNNIKEINNETNDGMKGTEKTKLKPGVTEQNDKELKPSEYRFNPKMAPFESIDKVNQQIEETANRDNEEQRMLMLKDNNSTEMRQSLTASFDSGTSLAAPNLSCETPSNQKEEWCESKRLYEKEISAVMENIQIVQTRVSHPKSPSDELRMERIRVFEEKITNDNNIEHMHSEIFPSTSTTGIGPGSLSSVKKEDVQKLNSETFRKNEVNEAVPSNNNAKENTNTKAETRRKYSCENYIDHSLEDKYIHVPKHVQSDTELNSIREKGKNKDLPGFRESQDLDSAEYKGHDSVFTISKESFNSYASGAVSWISYMREKML
ncbi:uncharacterized protein LOC128211367 [Mya arenaria]|uniref:uncharacterized protein LOC128211367 n=1 Tax=Mya arenaria TaxID=6604 RepID=UPI0022E4BBC1|nr:uncharacterized protein LOC128211367 [Mya arenaria]